MWKEEQSKSTNKQKETKQDEERQKGKSDNHQGHSTNRRVAPITPNFTVQCA